MLPDRSGGTQDALDDFHVTLEVFQGPFDLLLQLISRRRLDITEVALAEVTDEFIAHMQAFPDLSRTTEFLVVAATLLDMKAAHLLPQPEGAVDENAQDLEARDVLFSRLLQYRAYKEAGARIQERLEQRAGIIARTVPLEPHFAALLPELVWRTSAEDLARAAVEAFTHRPPTVEVTHLHDPVVPVRSQMPVIVEHLQRRGTVTFAELVADTEQRAVVVARFLGLLELYRRHYIDFAQESALAALTITWTGPDGYVIVDARVDTDEDPAGEDHQEDQE